MPAGASSGRRKPLISRVFYGRRSLRKALCRGVLPDRENRPDPPLRTSSTSDSGATLGTSRARTCDPGARIFFIWQIRLTDAADRAPRLDLTTPAGLPALCVNLSLKPA